MQTYPSRRCQYFVDKQRHRPLRARSRRGCPANTRVVSRQGLEIVVHAGVGTCLFYPIQVT